MTRIFPLFICCKHGELSFDDFSLGCCGHTVGFTKLKKIGNEVREAVPSLMQRFKIKHR